jgi:hypothetical protein
MTKIKTSDLISQLRERPRSGSAELCARLGGINRATLTRALKTLGNSLVVGGGSRRTRYALCRELRGNPAAIPLFRVDERGQGHEIGRLSLTYPEGSFLAFQETFPWPLDQDMADGWFGGLPYPLIDLRPQGFLGRNFARAHALDLGVSDNPEAWSDDDVAFILSTTGYDQPGDLILGETAYRKFLDSLRTGSDRFLPESAIEAAYLQAADNAMRHGDADSSAGGEFPKFTASRQLNGRRFDVIVKFSGADNSPAVRRWSDLLICEHLASRTMAQELHVEVASSEVCQFGGRTFLEVERFDRHGDFGRSPVCTLSSLNAALIGSAGNPWPKLARELHHAGWLQESEVARIALIWWFGRLIGNSDMHDGNLAFRPGHTLAPAYDMLPMAYAPLRGGELPNRQFAPELPLPADAATWKAVATAAISFWRTCSGDVRISKGFRQVCDTNHQLLLELLNRLA